MENYGTVTVYAYTSDARLPVAGAKVTVTGSAAPQTTAYTDRSGYVPPVTVPAPAAAQSQTPNRTTPFATVDITVSHPDYETEKFTGVQVFPGTVTVQSVRMIPANPLYPGLEVDIDTPAQDL